MVRPSTLTVFRRAACPRTTATAARGTPSRSATNRHSSALAAPATGGARPILALLIDWTFSLLMLALIVRVIGSWIGATRYTRWMRPFVALTEWFLGPLRSVLPAFGPFDFSPLVAWFLLSLLRSFILRNL